MTTTLRSMQVTDWGGPECLTEARRAVPEPEAGDVLIDVGSIGCNFFDALIIAGLYQDKPPLPFSPGAEVAGTVRAVGPDVQRFTVGQRVMGMLPHGGYSSVVAAREHSVFAIPDGMSLDQAAAFAIVYQTSYFALDYRARLQPGETLLVHAAAGGVGLAAVQIGKALGARVLGTAGSAEKCAVAEAHGAERCFNYRSEDWRALTKELTGGRGADVIYDPVGGDVFDQSLRTLGFGGRLLVIGFASGRIPKAPMNYVLLKNISLVGLHWGAYRTHDPAKIDECMATLFELFERGQVKPLVSRSWPLEQAGAALAALTSRETIGKVVLRP